LIPGEGVLLLLLKGYMQIARFLNQNFLSEEDFYSYSPIVARTERLVGVELKLHPYFFLQQFHIFVIPYF